MLKGGCQVKEKCHGTKLYSIMPLLYNISNQLQYNFNACVVVFPSI